MVTPWSAATYAAWRKTLPWTDEEFASAVEAEAEVAPNDFMRTRYLRFAAMARKGHINRYVLRWALPRLITTCFFCGKTALYRVGVEGRCREHRLSTVSTPATTYKAKRSRRDDVCSSDRQAARKDNDDKTLRRGISRASLPSVSRVIP